MPRSNSGKWVSRAAATGGGRTYRGQVPVNWYAALVLIVILGVASIIFANYEYRHPAAATSTVQPTKGTTWYAGLAYYVCGTQLPSLAANAGATTSKKSFYTTGTGLLTVAPKTAGDAGNNAVLGKFVAGYPGLALSADSIKVPSSSTGTTTTTAAGAKAAPASTTYKNGQACPTGTPDAGKKGQVQVVSWASAFNSKGKGVTAQGDPSDLKFTQNQLITVAFVPQGTTVPKPNGTVVKALVGASTGSTTTTTAPATPSATTTTAPATASTTTTAPPTTTTAPPASTTTTAPVTTTTGKSQK